MSMILGETPAPVIDQRPKTTIDLGVALVHLVSGEDLIAQTEFDTEHGVYLLARPVTPVMKARENGVSLGLIPYRPYLDTDEPIVLRDASVVFVGKLQDNLITHYKELTTNISIAAPGDIPNLRG